MERFGLIPGPSESRRVPLAATPTFSFFSFPLSRGGFFPATKRMSHASDPAILVRLLEIVTLTKLKQPANAAFPMLVTPLGIVTLISLQPANALPPMLATPLGIVTLVRLPQWPNAESCIVMTLLGIVTLTRLGLLSNA